jgi:hypothetical protein
MIYSGSGFFIPSREADPDPHYIGKPDPDPNLSEKAGSGSALKSKFMICTVEAQNGAMEGRERSQWSRGGSKWSSAGSAGT